ncbi:MAG TPA: ABC transporter permease [Candidatus Acidoferrales bacterium]|nr:ABC transporter permease [Candidatus Acidoferrales bacterium]
MSVIYILWLRQLKRYSRSRARIISSLGQPLIYLLGMGYGLGPVFRQAGMGSYIQFVTPGLIGMTVLFTSVFSGIELLMDRQFGFLKETLVAPVPRVWIILGRILGGATVAMLQGTLFLAACFIVGFRFDHIGGLPVMFLFMALTAVAFTALGSAIGSTLQDMQAFQFVVSFLIMPVFMLSGAIFPLTNLPRALTIATSANPLTYGVDGLRQSLISGGHFSLATDFAVLSVFVVLLVALAGYRFSRIQL